jgi:hypothetical protein
MEWNNRACAGQAARRGILMRPIGLLTLFTLLALLAAGWSPSVDGAPLALVASPEPISEGSAPTGATNEDGTGDFVPTPTATPTPIDALLTATSTPEPTATEFPTATPEPTATPTLVPIIAGSPEGQGITATNLESDPQQPAALTLTISTSAGPAAVDFGEVQIGENVREQAVIVTVSDSNGGSWSGGSCVASPVASYTDPPVFTWRFHNDAESAPWTPFSVSASDTVCIPAGSGADPVSYIYDYRLSVGPTTSPGTYTWTVTYTATSG